MDAASHHASALREDGFCVLRGLLPPGLVDGWREAVVPLLAEAMRTPPNRGPGRWYLDLPFAPPFTDPRLIGHPAVLALVEASLGEDAAVLHLGADTPAPGSEAQAIHSDVADLFPGEDVVPPAYALAVNIPLVDVDARNGPLEIARGTHRQRVDAGLRGIAAGAIALEPVHLRRGDVVVRDPRTLHRGTACLSAPRPVLVVAFRRPWFRHPGFPRIDIGEDVAAGLPPRARRLLRHHLEPVAALA